MRAVVQPVLSARVEVDHQTVSEIGPGLLLLVGFHKSDTDADADLICRNILNLQIFANDETGNLGDQSVVQKNHEILLVSQFTLYGALKGNRPDFHDAMQSHLAGPFYASLLEKFCQAYSMDKIKDGVFGVKRQIYVVNNGPVAIQLDSRISTVEDD